MLFKNRIEAGNELARHLELNGVESDTVLVASRRGIPVADAIADHFNVSIDMVTAVEIPAPGRETALGAVANDGTIWLKDRLLEELPVGGDQLERAIETELEKARERLESYRGDTGRPDLKSRDVVIVDDGVSSGLKMSACIGQAIKAAPSSITLATPVISSYAMCRLDSMVDSIEALEQLRFLESVDSCYGVVGSQEELEIQDSFAAHSG